MAADRETVGAPVAVSERPGGWVGTFRAMASPCEVHIADASREQAQTVTQAIAEEALRVERKYSRYLTGNLVDRINRAGGDSVVVDPETAQLLDYADTLYRLSEGRFDITSGVLRRAWTFDGGSAVPERARVRRLVASIGWHRVEWQAPRLTLPAGMEIDFGGFGKEYAVDRAVAIAARHGANCLINFGGDLRTAGSGAGGNGWRVGIEALESRTGPATTIRLTSGALATSGDAYRFLIHNGRRYGHTLDPLTGWPVENAPRSVTVCADTCSTAGMLATFAMLHGNRAEAFLESQSARYWCLR